jgi:flagellar motor switch protein FliN/FliY
MPAITPGTPLHSFLDTLRGATSEVLSQALGAKWTVDIDTNGSSSATDASILCFQLATSGGLQGGACIQIGTSFAVLLAQSFLQETADPAAALTQDHKDALEELLRQVAGSAAIALKGLFGETKLDLGISEPPTWEGVNVALLANTDSSGSQRLDLRLSPELLASVSSTKAATPPRPAVVPVAEIHIPDVVHEPNFDLLLGVKLNLTLRFGQRVLLLREILDLDAGSVIELDREVDEPADLLLGEKVIARGQVVIVDGNYGLRITEVTDVRQTIGAR